MAATDSTPNSQTVLLQVSAASESDVIETDYPHLVDCGWILWTDKRILDSVFGF